MTVDPLRSQLYAHPEWMNTQHPRINDTPDEVRADLTPLRQGKVVDVPPLYHGAHSFSLPIVNWLKRSIFA